MMIGTSRKAHVFFVICEQQRCSQPGHMSSLIRINKEADQSAHMRSLFSVFDICFMENEIAKQAAYKIELNLTTNPAVRYSRDNAIIKHVQ